MIRAILNIFPQAEGVLFDRQEVIKGLNPPPPRLTYCEGDFRDSPLPSGDLFLLKNILHDWDEPDAGKILYKCSAGLKAHGLILVIEIVKSDAPNNPYGKGLDLVMMALFSGRERTLSEFKLLGQAAGLKLVGLHRTSLPLSLIEFAKMEDV